MCRSAVENFHFPSSPNKAAKKVRRQLPCLYIARRHKGKKLKQAKEENIFYVANGTWSPYVVRNICMFDLLLYLFFPWLFYLYCGTSAELKKYKMVKNAFLLTPCLGSQLISKRAHTQERKKFYIQLIVSFGHLKIHCSYIHPYIYLYVLIGLRTSHIHYSWC